MVSCKCSTTSSCILYLDDLYLHILVGGRSIETVAYGLNNVVNKAAVWVVDVGCVPGEVTIGNQFLTRENVHKKSVSLEAPH